MKTDKLLIRRLLFIFIGAACVLAALFVFYWVVIPSASGLPRLRDNMSTGQYAQQLRELYPAHLIDPDPAKYVYGRNWPETESATRLGVVVGVVITIGVWLRLFRRGKRVG